MRRGVQSLGSADPLEKEIATHCSILVWKIPWTEEPVGQQSVGSQKNWTRLSNATKTMIYHSREVLSMYSPY